MSDLRQARDADQVLAALQAAGIERVHVGIFDVDASFRERRLALDQVRAGLAGEYAFVNVLHHWDTADSVHPGADRFVDEPVRIDSSSFRSYPFEPDAALAIADFTGPSAALSPRELLKGQIARAAARGFGCRAALEFEFIVLEENAATLREKRFEDLVPWPRDNRCWSGLTAATHAGFVADLEGTLRTLDVPVHSLGLELGPGCFETTLAARDALTAADDAALFKLYTKAFCRRRDLTASFMAQLSADFPGLSGHVHLSLADRDGRAVFSDPGSAEGVSVQLRHFVGGVLRLLPELTALCSHTVNAYRRMMPGNWAPRTPTWGFGNYTTAVRAIAAGPERTRLEFRVPAADTNPYLAVALLIGAGLWGIERRIAPPDPVQTDAREHLPEGLEPLPASLGEAAARLEASEAAREIFGAAFVEHFVGSRRAEEAAFRRHVSSFERARYLEAM